MKARPRESIRKTKDVVDRRQNNKHVTAEQQTCYGRTTNMLRQNNKHVTAEQQTCYGRTTNMLRQNNKHVTAGQQTCYGRTTNMLRQDNKHVTAVSPGHCAAASVLHNCCVKCCAEQSHKHNVRCTAVENQLRQKKSNFQAQLYLPTLHLFWANLMVQHHLPSLDLAWTHKSV